MTPSFTGLIWESLGSWLKVCKVMKILILIRIVTIRVDSNNCSSDNNNRSSSNHQEDAQVATLLSSYEPEHPEEFRRRRIVGTPRSP